MPAPPDPGLCGTPRGPRPCHTCARVTSSATNQCSMHALRTCARHMSSAARPRWPRASSLDVLRSVAGGLGMHPGVPLGMHIAAASEARPIATLPHVRRQRTHSGDIKTGYRGGASSPDSRCETLPVLSDEFTSQWHSIAGLKATQARTATLHTAHSRGAAETRLHTRHPACRHRSCRPS